MQQRTPSWILKLLKESSDQQKIMFHPTAAEYFKSDVIDKINSHFNLHQKRVIVLNANNYLIYNITSNNKFKLASSIEGKSSKDSYKLRYGILNILRVAYNPDMLLKECDFNAIQQMSKSNKPDIKLLDTILIYDRNMAKYNTNIDYAFKQIDGRTIDTINSGQLDSGNQIAFKYVPPEKNIRVDSVESFKKNYKPDFWVGDIVLGFPNKDMSEVVLDPDFFGVITKVDIHFVEDGYSDQQYTIYYTISWNGLSVDLSESRIAHIGFGSADVSLSTFNKMLNKYDKIQNGARFVYDHSVYENPLRYGSFFECDLSDI